MKGIFYNSVKATCSIWESGQMCFNILKQSHEYTLDYSENHIFYFDYDFVIYNQHYYVNNWITEQMVRQFGKPIFCIVTEITEIDNPIKLSPNFLTAYLVLDPSIKDSGNIYSFPRPLENLEIKNQLKIINYKDVSFPIIGSFGFATDGKRWDHIIEQVNREFDQAMIRFNIPRATYVPDCTYRKHIAHIHHQAQHLIKKPNISFEMTHNNYTKEELIEWCSKNTINVFFYHRYIPNISSGLAAVTDQAIVANRPLLVSNDPTFRHIHQYLNYYPNIGIKQAIEETHEGVKKMLNDWSQSSFLTKFEKILQKNNVR